MMGDDGHYGWIIEADLGWRSRQLIAERSYWEIVGLFVVAIGLQLLIYRISTSGGSEPIGHRLTPLSGLC